MAAGDLRICNLDDCAGNTDYPLERVLFSKGSFIFAHICGKLLDFGRNSHSCIQDDFSTDKILWSIGVEYIVWMGVEYIVGG